VLLKKEYRQNDLCVGWFVGDVLNLGYTLSIIPVRSTLFVSIFIVGVP